MGREVRRCQCGREDTAFGLRERSDTRFGVSMDLGLLTWDAGTDKNLGVLGDAVPDELLLQEGRC